jgi:hypothetical protein
MAFVGISGRLVDEVRTGIHRMARAEMGTVAEPERYQVTTENDWFVVKSWGDYYHLKDQMPIEWVQADSGGAQFRVLTQEHGTLNIDVTLQERLQAFPPRHQSYLAFTCRDNDETMPELLKQTIEAKKSLVEIEQRWDKVRDQVVEFLRNCKSLNEALKLWPEVEHYIPKEYIERALEKKEKVAPKVSKAVEILGQIDTQAVMASAVIARLSGATV